MSEQSQRSPAAVILQLSMGLRAAQALYVATRLGIADFLSERPMTGPELAISTGTHAPSLQRLVRTLVAVGVFTEDDHSRFNLTPVGQLLRKGTPQSLRSAVLFLAGETRWRCWSDLLGSVRTGEPATDRVLGMSLFDYYAANPEESQIHDEAMAAYSALAEPALVNGYDFSRFRSIVDVGGGSGGLLCAILQAYPRLHGVLFDLPHVVAHAHRLLASAGVADRCRIESGSFFETAPAGGDGYLLKQIIHDWDDSRARTILATCRRAISSDGTLLIFDRLVPHRAEPGLAVDVFLIDLEMLTMTPGGRERTEAEFRELLAGAGFALQRTIPTASPLAIIEARAA